MKNYVLNDIQILELYSILFYLIFFLIFYFISFFYLSDAVCIGNFVESKQNITHDDDSYAISPSNKYYF